MSSKKTSPKKPEDHNFVSDLRLVRVVGLRASGVVHLRCPPDADPEIVKNEMQLHLEEELSKNGFFPGSPRVTHVTSMSIPSSGLADACVEIHWGVGEGEVLI